MRNIHYSTEQIKRLSKDSRIKHIDQYSIRFTLEYRLSIYERVLDNICIATVRQVLLEDGFNLKDIKSNQHFCHNLTKSFKSCKPHSAKNNVFGNSYNVADNSYNQFLLDSGKFVKNCNGISFSEEYKSEIYHTYPETSIEDFLTHGGFDIQRIGYQRIYQLKREFDGESSTSSYYSETLINQLNTNIYVKTMTHKQLRFHNQFYKDATHLSSLHIDEILTIFEVDYALLPVSLKKRIESKIINKVNLKIVNDIDLNEQYLRIQRNINKALTSLVDDNFNRIKSSIYSFDCSKRKDVVELIKDLYALDGNEYSITYLCNRCGISRSNYYHILNNHDYGDKQIVKEIEDNYYIDKIKEIIAYRDIPKGSRMIYMMQDDFGMHISRNKINRLCRKGDIVCTVRKASASRKAANELLKKNTKPNLLKRQFKLNRPNKILLTDVTYIKYDGKSKTAYLSDVKDAVTGKSIGHVLSRNNDLNLVLNTLKKVPIAVDGEIIHSDQGILYLNDTFQLKVKELGYLQSMSKRGNCWDNASKESQYGHMKDEISFSSIQTFDELKAVIDDYYDYYNNERPQWTRNKMTPIEFEAYLNTLCDEEYDNYIDIERRKYDNMMERATKRAIKRATDLKAL